MTCATVSIPYVAPSSAAAATDPWVHLEQKTPPAIMRTATLRDVYRLWMAAASGQSAQMLRVGGCPIEFNDAMFRIYLGFYIWPSEPSLPFELTATNGRLLGLQPLRKPRECSYFLNNAARLDLPSYMEQVALSWESPRFNRYGEGTADPAVTVAPTTITFEPEVFAGCRVASVAVGYESAVQITIGKEIYEDAAIEVENENLTSYQVYESGHYKSAVPPKANLNSNKISNLTETITVAWEGLDGTKKTEQLRMEIPQCVQDILSMCPGQYDKYVKICSLQKSIVAYYDGCTGEIIFTKEGKSSQSLCAKIELRDRPWWVSQEFYDRAQS